MRGFLSKWLNQKSSGNTLGRSGRHAPKLSTNTAEEHQGDKPRDRKSFENPDAVFLEYEEWSSDTPLTTSNSPKNSTQSATNSFAPEDIGFDKTFQDEIWTDAETPGSYEPHSGVAITIMPCVDGIKNTNDDISSSTETIPQNVIDERTGYISKWPLLVLDKDSILPDDLDAKTAGRPASAIVQDVDPNASQPPLTTPKNQIEGVLAAVTHTQGTEENRKNDDDSPSKSKWAVTELLPIEHACVSCGESLAQFQKTIKIWFCPFCGAEQTYEQHTQATIETHQVIASPAIITAAGLTPTEPQQDESSSSGLVSKSTPVRSDSEPAIEWHDDVRKISVLQRANIEAPDDLSNVDELFDASDLDYEHAKYAPPSMGRIYFEDIESTETYEHRSQQLEDWEIFLDEDLDESSPDTLEYYESEDPLEAGRIAEYASKLTESITVYKTTAKVSTYAFFIGILGDFPYYQSYAAIQRLISKGAQIDHLADVYEIKMLWLNNPYLWAERRYDSMARIWNTSRNPQLRNSMSWQLASDLARNYPTVELENLILSDWYSQWLDLALVNDNSPSGWEPTYGMYPAFLNEKRKPLPTTLNSW